MDLFEKSHWVTSHKKEHIMEQEVVQAVQAKKSRWVGIGKAAGALTLAAAVFVGGGSLAGWHDSKSIGTAGQKIQTGQLALDTTSLGWTFNGDAITEAQVDTLRLSPGDHLAYTGEAEVTLDGDNLKAELGLTDAATAGSLASSPVVDVAWSVGGSTDPLTLTAADDGKKYPISWTLDLAPVSDAGYVTGTEAQLGELELREVKVELTQVAK